MKTFKDDFGNSAIIKEVLILPYRGCKEKEKGYELSLISEYDDNRLYFLSIYEDEKSAINQLKKFSCNTWKQNKKY